MNMYETDEEKVEHEPSYILPVPIMVFAAAFLLRILDTLQWHT